MNIETNNVAKVDTQGELTKLLYDYEKALEEQKNILKEFQYISDKLKFFGEELDSQELPDNKMPYYEDGLINQLKIKNFKLIDNNTQFVNLLKIFTELI